DIFNSKFSYSSVSPRWVSGDQYIYQASNRDVFLKNANDLSVVLLMPGSFYTDNSASSYKVSSTMNYILLLTNYVKGWRHSYNGTYLVFDVQQQQLRSDLTFPDQVQYITWAPVGDALAYVYDFNIYYRPIVTQNNEIQVTSDGRANFVYNGIPDWVYEEEMISSNNVMYFSPDGQILAYAQFNDTECAHIQFSRYNSQYPEMIDVSYPKAGTTQPTNRVFMYNTVSDMTQEAIPPLSIAAADYLFSRVTWANETSAAVIWCNRLQTWSVMSFCDVMRDGSLSCPPVAEYEHKTTTGWLYQRRPYWIPVFAQNQREYFVVLPNNDWQHLARVNLVGIYSFTFLTEGDYTVTSYSASYPAVELYDADKKRQVYRTKGSLGATIITPECITCKLMGEYPGRCNIATSSFSTDGSHVVIACRGNSNPDNVLVGKVVLEDNADLVTNIANTLMPEKTYGQIQSTTGYKFAYEMWKPPNFSNTKQYPLLIDVYAGPGYQNVDAYWSRSWSSAFVPSSLDVIVVRVDGRGSNFYGDQLMHEVYQQLGQKEIDDQIEAAQYFSAMPYVDSSRIAIWGWSYGGFATSHAMGSNPGVYYDTIYAERYMGLPSDNTDGYDKANVVNKAATFTQSSYYLIHGTADDNVHFQNAAQLSKALVDEDIRFNNFFYADQDHSINVGNARYHIYKILTRQLCKCFDLQV
uniref:Uncharacterized protein n=1 Tax=Ciona savignyi TaxID=51511 RepID=H2YEQ6_CIOSA